LASLSSFIDRTFVARGSGVDGEALRTDFFEQSVVENFEIEEIQ